VKVLSWLRHQRSYDGGQKGEENPKPGPALQLPPLTGRWHGYYVQRDLKHSLTADLKQDKSVLKGTMMDATTEVERSIFEMVVAEGLPPGTDELIIARFRASFPDMSCSEIRCVMHLPTHSIIEGSIKERRVSYRKSYQGESFSGFRIGKRYVGARIQRHVVNYLGLLNDSGTRIEGTWSIPGPERSRKSLHGSFVLVRDPGNLDRVHENP
jgi:hypothetical protein